MIKKRILFILLAVVLAISVGLIGCTTTEEEEEEEPVEALHLIFSDHNAPTNACNRALQAYAAYLGSHSDGCIIVDEVGHDGIPIAQGDVFTALQAASPAADAASYVPEAADNLFYMQIFAAPFMGWADPQQAMDIYADITDDFPEILAEMPSSLYPGPFYVMPGYHLHWTGAGVNVVTPGDAAGWDVRALEGNLADILTMAGMTGSVVPFPDIWSVFGSASPPDGFAMHKEFLYGVPGVIEFFHSHTYFQGGIVVTPMWLLWNKASYNAVLDKLEEAGLDAEEVMAGAEAAWLDDFFAYTAQDTAGYLSYMTTHDDTEVTLTAAQTAVWADAVSGWYDNWKGDCADSAKAQAILDAVKALIAAG